MKAIDTHAHLDFNQFDSDRADVIAKLETEDIGVINISSSLESISQVVELTKNRLIWGAIGLHPDDITDSTLVGLPSLLDQWALITRDNPKIVAVGEVGLDYYQKNDKALFGQQQTALRSFITFANEKKLPLVFHCREAYGDLLTILHDYPGTRGVVHCFSADQELAEQFLALGLNLSFTAMLSYPKNEYLRAIAKETPLDRIMLETDCPFLPVQEKRGQRNDPWAILRVAEIIAQEKSQPLEEILRFTTQNAQKMFNIS